jgi:hypothetical protein
MSVNLNLNRNAVAFAGNGKSSYPGSAVKGAVLGGVVGAVAVKTAGKIVEKSVAQSIPNALTRLAETSIKKASLIGAGIGAAILVVVHAIKAKKAAAVANNLTPKT